MQSKIDQLKLMGPVILSGILKSLDTVSSSESGLLPMQWTLLNFCSFAPFTIRWKWQNFNLIDIVHWIYPDVTVRDSKTFAYQAIGLLSQRMPQLFRFNIFLFVSSGSSFYILWLCKYCSPDVPFMLCVRFYSGKIFEYMFPSFQR